MTRNLLTLLLAACTSLVPLAGQADSEIGGILARADIGYGEYLSGECVTCHHQKGAEEGIPNIRGLNAEAFVSVMMAFKNKEIDHDLMQTVAGRLDEEQIASLAVYFASLSEPN